MTTPLMPLEDAWRILGADAATLLGPIRQIPTRKERVAAVEELLSQARKLAKKLALRYHPDRNPGDTEVAAKFREVRVALECIEEHTKALRKRSDEIDQIPPRDGFIEIIK